MTYSEREAAFTKLVSTRNRMLEIRKQITDVRAHEEESRRYLELQIQLDNALHEFQAAATEFSETVRHNSAGSQERKLPSLAEEGSLCNHR
jgi:hypothetical protein